MQLDITTVNWMHLLRLASLALAGMAQWIEYQPVDQRVSDSILNLAHMPELLAGSPVGGAREATAQCCLKKRD